MKREYVLSIISFLLFVYVFFLVCKAILDSTIPAAPYLKVSYNATSQRHQCGLGSLRG